MTTVSAAPARPPPPSPSGDASAPRWDRAAAGLVLGLSALRVALLFASPLELYPDEAQYWLWSRRLAFGYFSKPPMIAWLIAGATAVGGNGEAWVRLCAPVLHGVAAWAVSRAARRWFDARTGFWAAAVYLLMPGVQLSSEVVATDAPLLAFLALALWALAALWTSPAGGGRRSAAALGAALGLGALSKYAALYAVAGLVVHAALDREGRRRLWSAGRVWPAAAAFLVVLAPNLLWNALHGFQTVAHTAADADIGDGARARGFDPRGGLGFVLGQFGVFGPVPFAVLAGGTALAMARRRAFAAERLLLALAWPPLVVVLGEAVAVRANANWAAAAYVAGSVLAAAWLGRAPVWRAAGLGLQAAACGLLMAVMVAPGIADRAGLGNSLKRARGWRATVAAVHAHLLATQASGPVTALAVDDRFLFNAAAYYGRDWISAPGAPPFTMWVHEARAKNQAEASAPLTPALGGRVAFASLTWKVQSRWDFRRVTNVHEVRTPLDARRTRDLLLYVGEGFAPRPRDPRTGLPVPPP